MTCKNIQILSGMSSSSYTTTIEESSAQYRINNMIFLSANFKGTNYNSQNSTLGYINTNYLPSHDIYVPCICYGEGYKIIASYVNLNHSTGRLNLISPAGFNFMMVIFIMFYAVK